MKVKIWSKYGEQNIPFQKNEGDAGWDLFAPHDITMPANSECLIDTGLVLDFSEEEGPTHYLIYPRSSLGVKYGINLKNSTGVIDKPYCGPNDTVKVPLVRNCYKRKIEEFPKDSPLLIPYHIEKGRYELVEHINLDGEEVVSVFEMDNSVYTIKKGERFAQIVFYRHVTPEFEFQGEKKKDGKSRGGLGSSGK